MKPLALLIKYYLKQFGMNEPYTGGLGSYALIIMIISYLQVPSPSSAARRPMSFYLHSLRASLTHTLLLGQKKKLHKPRAVEKQQDLGVLFLGFLKLYGQEFNYFRYTCHDTAHDTDSGRCGC